MVELSGLSSLARIVDPVAQRFVDAGFRIYLVGGIVRDLFLAERDGQSSDGQPFDAAAGDIDLTTDAPPADIKKLVSPLAEALWAQGERFGTIGATIDGQAMEITTHRAEAYDPASRKPVVTFGQDLMEDLSRRDFTINAMAIELPSQTVHDPYGGVADLEAKLLRTPLSPEISFTDDPLRIMRAARFIARFDLSPSAELLANAVDLAERLSIVSVERVADELERLLAVADPKPGLAFLADTGTLPIDVGYDTELSVELAASATDPVVRRAGLLWPLGDDARSVLQRLRYSRAATDRTRRLIESTAQALQSPAEPQAARRIAARVGPDDLPLVSSLVSLVAQHDGRYEAHLGSTFAATIDQLASAEDLSDLGSPLTGQMIIETLDVEPGPIIGRAQRFLIDKRLEQGPLSKPEAQQLLQAWWADEKQSQQQAEQNEN
ncbi:MAG: hypothetical protein ACRBK7_20200 [Acidimicrobiales bacterium]